MTAGAVQSLITAGKLRPLAVSSAQRISTQPGVPTIAESGYPEFEISNSFGAFVPLGTPIDVIIGINAAFNKAIRAQEVRKRLAGLGYEGVGGSPEQHDLAMKRDMSRIEALVTAGSLTFE